MGRSRGALSLGRAQRLRRPKEIQALFERGRRDERRSFLLLWQQGAATRRVAFTVSRRVGGAVERNRARRRMREAYRRCQHMQPRGVDVVFVGRPLALSLPFTKLEIEMSQALEALGRAVSGSRAERS